MTEFIQFPGWHRRKIIHTGEGPHLTIYVMVFYKQKSQFSYTCLRVYVKYEIMKIPNCVWMTQFLIKLVYKFNVASWWINNTYWFVFASDRKWFHIQKASASPTDTLLMRPSFPHHFRVHLDSCCKLHYQVYRDVN